MKDICYDIIPMLRSSAGYREKRSCNGTIYCRFTLGLKAYYPKTGLHNIRPAGHMRPARSFLAARENSVAENVAKA